MKPNRETDIIQAFTGLTNQLVDHYDVVDLTTRLTEDCAQLLDVEAVGLLLADAGGVLHVLAATSAEARKLEAFQLQRDEGPCLDCFHTGAAVNVADLRAEAARWPTFARTAAQQGFRSVHAIPIRLRQERLGAMGLFGVQPGILGEEDLQLAQGLADVAAIAIVQNNPHLDQANTLPALRAAVAGRAVVEIAKGFLSEELDLDMQEAFTRLRAYAHRRGRPLTDVARQVVSGDLSPADLLASEAIRPS